jgi:hypothetical protein
VTIETFLEWKKRFIEEKSEEDKNKKVVVNEIGKGRLTGRQLFEQDASLFTTALDDDD